MPALQLRSASMTVNAVSLMRSDRGRNGMIYTELGAVGASANGSGETMENQQSEGENI